MSGILQQAQEMMPQLTGMMNHLHQYPELSFEEFETTRYLKQKMEQLGAKIIETGMPTGFAAVLHSGKKGPAVGIRADIDAIAETETAAVQFPSKIPGKMHACGHDMHMVCACGAAALLAEQKSSLAGDVVFIFQPGEEATKGAQAMLECGLLDKIGTPLKALFGQHVSAAFPAGVIGVSAGATAAGKINFKITLRGRAGHGGFPHQYDDVLLAGAALTTALQAIVSRNADPFKALVVAVCSVKAGSLGYFVTDTLEMTGSIRALDEPLLEMALCRLREISDAVAKAHRCTCEIEVVHRVPPLVNDPALAQIGKKAAVMVAGVQNVKEVEPMLGSDDFSVFGAHMPVLYYSLGAVHPSLKDASLHHNNFCVDHEALAVGSALLAQSVLLAQQELPG